MFNILFSSPKTQKQARMCMLFCRVVSCRVVSCRVVSCRVVSCRVSVSVLSCRIMSNDCRSLAVSLLVEASSFHLSPLLLLVCMATISPNRRPSLPNGHRHLRPVSSIFRDLPGLLPPPPIHALPNPNLIPYPIPYTLYPIPYTLYPIPHTLYHLPYTLYLILYPISYTLYPILHPTPYTLTLMLCPIP